MTEELSPTQLGYIRRDGQRSRLYLAIHKPATIFAARVNQAFADSDSKDKVVEVDFDGVTTGAYTDILAGMTCYVGSTAGGYDLGMVRMRKVATATKIFPGENSDVKWADNAYLTVVDEFGIWAKYPRLLADGTVYMDYDVAYSNQHSAFKPVVVMGSDAVLWLTGEDVAVGFDASDSWCLSSGSKTYAWTASGGSVTGETTATPTFTFSSVGVYRIACTVTVGGVSSTGYRHVFVYSPSNPPISAGGTDSGFTLAGSPSADMERGGWEFDVTMYGATADISNVRDGAMVILFSRDWYGNDELYIGAQAGRENIKCMGWIAAESIVVNPMEGSANFSVRGPHYFIEKLASFVDGIESGPATPAAWTSIQELTVDKAIWHLLEWRSTVTAVMDFRRSDDTHQAKALQTAQGGLLSQIRANSEPVFASPRFDRYGRLFLEVEAQLVSPVSRGDFPTVLTIEKNDWQNALHITRNTMSRESRVEMSGVYYADGSEPLAYFSLAGGHVFKRFGEAITVERLLLSGQSEANERAGLILGWHNRKYEFEINSASNNCMVDIAPRQYVGVNVAAEDSPRGVAYSGRVIVRRVMMEFESATGFLHNTWIGEEETFAENNVNGDIPPSALSEELDTSVPASPKFPPMPPLGELTYPSPTTPPANNTPPKEIIIKSSNFGVMYTKNYGANWYFMNAGLSEFDRNDIVQLVVTPSGAAYALLGGFDKVMVADSLGGTWRTLFLASSYPESGSHIYGIGINPTKSDEIAIWGGRPWSWSTDGNYGTGLLALGGRGGVSIVMGSATQYLHNDESAVVYSNGGWSIFHSRGTGIQGNFAASYMSRFNESGTPLYQISLQFNVGQGGLARRGVGAGTQDKVFQWDDGGYAGYAEIVGMTANWLTGIDLKDTQGVSFSPTGNFAMGVNAAAVPYKTSDGGATWTSAGGVIPTGQRYWQNCGDDFRWLWAGGNVVRFSSDFGATYAEIVGDMITTAPLIDITGIRMVRL